VKTIQLPILLLICSPVWGLDCSNASVWLNVVEKTSTVERDIQAQDLHVEIDGKPTKVISVSLDQRPRRIVLMVDTSGSMRREWGITVATASFAADVIPSSATAALFIFDVKSAMESDGFESHQEIQRRVLELAKREPKGFTALWNSIDQVLSRFADLQSGDAIYLVTDGEDNRGMTPFSALQQHLLARGIRVFLFLVQTSAFDIEKQRHDSLILGIAESSGGYVVPITWERIGENERRLLLRLAPQIVDQAEAVYRVQIELPKRVAEKGQVKIAFADSSRRARIRYIGYSHYVVPCVTKH
jgi:hypothetical protein